MGTYLDVMRIALKAIIGLFVARSAQTYHPALATIVGMEGSARFAGGERLQQTRDVAFAQTLSVVGGYAGCGSGPP